MWAGRSALCAKKRAVSRIFFFFITVEMGNRFLYRGHERRREKFYVFAGKKLSVEFVFVSGMINNDA